MAEKSVKTSASRRGRNPRPLAPVLTLVPNTRHQRGSDSVIAELHSLLARAIKGEFIGLAYVTLGQDDTTKAALAGDLARKPNRQRAVGMLFSAAMGASYEDEEG